MARKIYYKVFDKPSNTIADAEWDEILRLQHWYNSEFIWTGGKLMFKMFAVFPNFEQHSDEERLWQTIVGQRRKLRDAGQSENEIVRQMEADGLVIVKKGGYFDQCLASGFTRVAGNEWNAFLVSEFLLKCSLVAPRVLIDIYDEGEYIKSKHIRLQNGCVIVPRDDIEKESFYQAMVLNRHVFAVVDPAKYDQFPAYQTTFSDFNDKNFEEKRHILHDVHWLGYENNFDINGDDIQGVDLNKKVMRFQLEDY